MVAANPIERKQWEEDLATVLSMDVEGVDCYKKASLDPCIGFPNSCGRCPENRNSAPNQEDDTLEPDLLDLLD